MFTVRTLSGTTYTVHNGRLTRLGDPIRNVDVNITEAVFANVRPPRVGEPWQFRLTGFANNPITTTPVVEIIEPMSAEVLAAFERIEAEDAYMLEAEEAYAYCPAPYCPAHDLYNCPFGA